MIKGRIRLWPRGIAGQIVVLVISVVVIFQLIAVAMFAFLSEPAERRPFAGALAADRIVEFVRILDLLPVGSRAEAAAAMRAAFPSFSITILPPEGWGQLGLDAANEHQSVLETFEGGNLLHNLQRSLGSRFSLRLVSDASQYSVAPAQSDQRTIAIRLGDGHVFVGSIPKAGGLGAPGPFVPLALMLGLTAMMLATFLWWAARALTTPLAKFANAASQFSLDRNPASLLEERGPDEVRLVSKALNRMQRRIRGMIDSRTRMLAAVSHDLRTPITRMRLRVEFVDDSDTQDQMLRDLDQMDRMVHGALSYLRDGATSHSHALIDIASLVQTVCSDFSDLGSDVVYQGPAHLLAHGNSEEIQSALTNLIENALKHGGCRAVVELKAVSGTELIVGVTDDGPGISNDVKQAMLEPFARGDAARAIEGQSTGFGLGLAIASAASEAHGGKLLLLDALPNGLCAQLQLPIRVDLDQLSNSGSVKLESR
jgi:signal transduction histidine kinase